MINSTTPVGTVMGERANAKTSHNPGVLRILPVSKSGDIQKLKPMQYMTVAYAMAPIVMIVSM